MTMSYEKCFLCPHSDIFYEGDSGKYNGMIIVCKITGEAIEINECVKKGVEE